MKKDTNPFTIYPSPKEHEKLLQAAKKQGKKLSRWALERLLKVAK